MNNKTDFEFVHIYTRKQALEDGVLIDATALAKEAGFVLPVALTTAAWGTCVTVPEECTWQDESGRLWDVLWMLHLAVKRAPDVNPLHFSLHVQTAENRSVHMELKAVCGPGDDHKPVVTIMLPNED